ncbi:MAG: metalloregulator ArsR/SmtB family transcription factor [Thermoanaerobaculales bacterium]|nr:metalloregulator ArsR/SmtB family transcription factor [Thermoanaerobaculales bacterium]
MKNSPECNEPDRSPEQLAALRQSLVAHRLPLNRLAQHYALLGGETRLKILVLLRRVGELCVCDLARVLEMTPAAVSQHLSRLRSGNLVDSRRDGMTIYYRLSDGQDDGSSLPELRLPGLDGV